MLKFLRCFHILLYCSSSCTVLIYYKSSFFQAKPFTIFSQEVSLWRYDEEGSDWFESYILGVGWIEACFLRLAIYFLRMIIRTVERDSKQGFATGHEAHFLNTQFLSSKGATGGLARHHQHRNHHQQHSHHHQGAWKLKLQSKSVVNWKISRGQSHYKIYEWK